MNVSGYSAPARNLPPVIINDVTMPPIEVNGERVVTLSMIDKVHGRPDGTASRNFRENRARLTEGEDYYEVTQPDEIRRLGVVRPQGGYPAKVIAITEDGYLMLVKSLNDDLAWKVQKALVRAYFKKPKLPVLPTRGPRLDVNREHRLTMKDQVTYAKMAGLTGNQALLAANRATTLLTGIDNLGLLGIASLPAPQNEALLSPSDIAAQTEYRSGRAVNDRLCALALQIRGRDHKGRIYYEPTDAGAAAGGTMQDIGKKHGDGTPVRQLKWASSIIRYLEEADGQRH